MASKNLQNQPFFGLSEEDKPLNVNHGTAFIEMDTSKLYFFDANNQVWLEWGASSNNSSSNDDDDEEPKIDS